MDDLADIELLGRYARQHDEACFAELVKRHIRLVYAAALRCVHNPTVAEDVTQTAFMILARKANSLSPNTILCGWLYRTACLAAADALKQERRRQARETDAMSMHLPMRPKDELGEVSDLIDDVMTALPEKDRNAVLLHFFENKTFVEIGEALGLTQDSARMRVNRAVERLGRLLKKRGCTASVAALAVVLSAGATASVPTPLVSAILAACAAQGAAGKTALLNLTLKTMAWTKIKTGALVGACALLIGENTLLMVRRFERQRLRESSPQTQGAIRIAGPERREATGKPALRWSSVESPDYAQYIANMRGIGMPEQTIRDVVRADIESLYRPRLGELKSKVKEKDRYWLPRDPDHINERFDVRRDEETIAALRALVTEKAWLNKKLLGVDVDVNTMLQADLAVLSGQWSFLGSDKQAAVMEAEQRFEAGVRQFNGIDWATHPEAERNFLQCQSDRDKLLGQSLTAEEKFEYDVRFSPTADMLRATLWYFKPTEGEFRLLVQAQKAFDDHIREERLSGAVPDGQLPEDYSSSWKQAQQQIQSDLGDKRYRQYRMSGDGIYRQSLRFTEQNNLSTEIAASLYEIRYDLADLYKAQVMDTQLEGSAREAKLHQLRILAEVRLRDALGEAGYAAYRASSYAQWVGQIEQGVVPAKLRP